ncbi:CPBP family intramembrane glutamic endopeptidase [Leptothoe spongobia]|uniref:CPBP family intramembrane metalloprotease n=1 Tax=Leptothoe spongobia TAU-MAC 1115 TaxID=1967444 RepID=A0A947DAW3_9CYAN|nr:type II CAAX endopeptidase family protein [Leptothoe spongobia]MBT9314032.1 CPBP family intramembrane metalloprotease [Leptothoe spongobia TAU-MAC 1115]
MGYAKAKGYAAAWGWFGLFNWLGLSLLIVMPDRRGGLAADGLAEDDAPEKVFSKINLVGILLKYFALGTLYAIPVLIGAQLSGQNLAEIKVSNQIGNIIGIVLGSHFIVILFKMAQAINLDLSAIFGLKQKTSSRMIGFTILSAAALFTFSFSFNRVTLYGLSHVSPGYVENYFESTQTFTNIPELILFFCTTIILAPLLEEFIFRGVIFQKWGLRWGVTRGLVASSLLFSVIHIRFDIIPIFLGGLFLALLYMRTSSLVAPMLCHALYNATAVGWKAIKFFGQPAAERETVMSVSDFQSTVSPWLDRYVVVAVMSLFLLLYLFYKLLPRQHESMPYLRNQALVAK